MRSAHASVPEIKVSLWYDRGFSGKKRGKKRNPWCHRSISLTSCGVGFLLREQCEVWMVEMCPVKALNKMFEMQFQRLGGCLEAPQRNTFPAQREQQMVPWCRTKESEANRHVSSMADTWGWDRCPNKGRQGKRCSYDIFFSWAWIPASSIFFNKILGTI